MSPAPIILFVYNRPAHTSKTIESLKKNDLAKDSELIIFSDDAKDSEQKNKVKQVREYIKDIDGFKEVKIVYRQQNYGLARNIIEGVTSVIDEYGKVIVLEDDLVTSRHFLEYMNMALNFYEHNENIMHISSYTYPVEKNNLPDYFLFRVPNSWGWGTWKKSWSFFEKDVNKLIKECDKNTRRDFDLNNSGAFWSQVRANKKGKMDSWAIFWYYSIYKRKAYSLYPKYSFAQNIGHDGSGKNCRKTDIFNSEFISDFKTRFCDLHEENMQFLNRVEIFYKKQKKNILQKCVYKLFNR